jgi:isopentenyl diphosphate isomerase/L-lactate dehydrogenase-like FMN-dependent dehydrogenase
LEFKIWSRYVNKNEFKHKEGTSAHADFLKHFIDGSFSWENVAEYKQKAGLPIVIKGIQCP